MITIELLAQQTISGEVLQKFLKRHRTSWQQTKTASSQETLCEFAGRICYMSFGDKQYTKRNRDYLANIINQGHESVLEHAVWTVLVEGISRACSHQLVRHRVGWAFSQLSQQYHEESDPSFVLPRELVDNPEISRLWQSACTAARDAYTAILNHLESDETIETTYSKRERLRLVRTAARSVLPNSIETKIVATVNARALRHFLHVRGSTPGDREMRDLACKLYETLAPTAPNLFADFALVQLNDGYPAVEKVGKQA